MFFGVAQCWAKKLTHFLTELGKWCYNKPRFVSLKKGPRSA